MKKTKVCMMMDRRICVVLLMSMLLISLFTSGAASLSTHTVGETIEYDLEEIEYDPVVIDLDDSRDVGLFSVFTEYPDLDIPNLRHRAFYLHPQFETPERISEGSTIHMNLFSDKVLTTNIHTTTMYMENATSLRGTIEGYEWGFVVLIINDGNLIGTIEIPENNERFVIRTNSQSSLHYIFEVDVTDIDTPPSIGPLEIQESGINVSKNTQFSTNDLRMLDYDPYEPVTIDVFPTFTTEAKDTILEFGYPSFWTFILEEIEISNTVLQNSHAYLTLNPKPLLEVYWLEESGDSEEDLAALRNCDVVHNWRRHWEADLVVLYAYNQHCVAGLGHTLNTLEGVPERGYSLVNVQHSSANPIGDSIYTLIHEVGHNLGAHHKDQQDYVTVGGNLIKGHPGPTEWTDWPENGWSAGWRWNISFMGTKIYRCSVMTYTSGNYFEDGQDHIRLGIFSNPERSFYGVPMGHDTYANNTGTIRITKHIVSSYSDRIVLAPEISGELVTTLPYGHKISWMHEHQDVTSYKIYIGSNDPIEIDDLPPVGSEVTYTNSNVDIGVPITYSVTAITDEWESYHSEQVTLTLPLPEPPVIDGYWDYGGHHIYWSHADTKANNVLNVDAYVVEWKHTHEGEWNYMPFIHPDPEEDEIIFTHSDPPPLIQITIV